MSNQQLIMPARVVDRREYEANKDNYEKVYLLLLVFIDENDEETRSWELKRGRREVYDYLKDYVIHERSFDVVGSKVLGAGKILGDEVNVGKFLRYAKDSFFEDDDFDVSDYFQEDTFMPDDTDQLLED